MCKLIKRPVIAFLSLRWLYPGKKVCVTGSYMTSLNQGHSPNDKRSQRRKSLGTRLLFRNLSQMTSNCGKNYILSSSVIFFWTDAPRHEIYLFYAMEKKQKIVMTSSIHLSYNLSEVRTSRLFDFLNNVTLTKIKP